MLRTNHQKAFTQVMKHSKSIFNPAKNVKNDIKSLYLETGLFSHTCLFWLKIFFQIFNCYKYFQK